MESGRVPKGFHGSKEVEGTKERQAGAESRAGQGRDGSRGRGQEMQSAVQCSAVLA